MLELSIMKTVVTSSYVPLVGNIPFTRKVRECRAYPTGRWKIVVTEGKEPELYLECNHFRGATGWERWVHEDDLEFIEVPDPPKVVEYINGCSG